MNKKTRSLDVRPPGADLIDTKTDMRAAFERAGLIPQTNAGLKKAPAWKAPKPRG